VNRVTIRRLGDPCAPSNSGTFTVTNDSCSTFLPIAYGQTLNGVLQTGDCTTIFGDGSQQQKSGIMGALMGAGKRLLTAESLFMTVFQNQLGDKRRVAFGAPIPGKIIPTHLAELGGELICQKDAFLAAAKGVSIGIAFQRKLGVGLFGGEGFIMQRLQGDGWAFVHAGGTIIQRQLAPGEVLEGKTLTL
jgi:uncharacterized protein (AIM24 family)